MQEVLGFLKLLNEVYEVFGLDYTMALSTRPEGYLGELEMWNKAEAALTSALNSSGRPWTINEGEGTQSILGSGLVKRVGRGVGAGQHVLQNPT